MIRYFTGLLFVLTTMQIQVVVDYSKDPYTALREALGKDAIQNSDACDDRVKHITSEVDPILNRRVFLYNLHVRKGYVDGDRCLRDYSRQRCQTSVQPSSPTWMYGNKNKTFTYAWKLYLDPSFKVSGKFCHLHQIKLDGKDVGDPNLTLTARNDVQLENEGKILVKVPLSSFRGVWIQIRQKITYNSKGCLEFAAHRMKDGFQLMKYSGCNVALNNNGKMIRPKFGFYRSLQSKGNLRNQAIKMVDLCIGEGDSCYYDHYGNKQTSSLSINN